MIFIGLVWIIVQNVLGRHQILINWKFHTGNYFYDFFLDRVKENTNKFFKNMKHTLKGISETRTVFLNGKLLTPELSQKYHNHSPDGFNWGYGGSGPSQLALAVVLEITGKPDNYQDFKWNVISKLPMDKDFEIEIEL